MISQPGQADCKERVAYELMHTIATEEADAGARQDSQHTPPREYWLTLYQHCLAVVSGQQARHTLER